MTRDWKYILYITFAFGAFLLLKLSSPKQHNWTITYAADDKNPFGGYALNALARTHFSGPLRHSFKTLYELKDSVKAGSGVLVVAEKFSPGEEDALALLDHIYEGGSAFISARHMNGPFADTLKLKLHNGFGSLLGGEDSSTLHLVATPLDTLRTYAFEDKNIDNYFRNFDTTRTTVIAANEQYRPVTLRMKWGKGDIILNSTPLMFTNICLLSADNADFVSAQLSYLPASELTWTEYYQLGRREITTPLRFILLNEPLRWAYYIALFSLVVFMLFELKRRQRIIPVIPPLANTTLEFVSTIGDLYHQNGDHKNIAEKKITYFLEQVRTKYALNTNQLNDAFSMALAKKTGKEEVEVTALIRAVREMRARPGASAEQLIDLNSKLETFYNNE